MKTILSLLILIFFNFNLFSQSLDNTKNSLTFQLGRSFYGTGDMTGRNLSFSFTHKIKNTRFDINPVLSLSYAAHNLYLVNNMPFRIMNSSNQLDLNITYNLLTNSKHKLKLGVGPSIAQITSTVPAMLESGLIPDINNEIFMAVNYYYSHDLNFTVLGMNLTTEYNYIIKDKFIIGANATYSRFYDGETFLVDGNNDEVIFRYGIVGGLKF